MEGFLYQKILKIKKLFFQMIYEVFLLYYLKNFYS